LPAPTVAGAFPPSRVFFELGPENYSPRLLRKIVFAGGQFASFALAVAGLRELGDHEVSARHVETLTLRIGRERAAERDDQARRWEAHETIPPAVADVPEAVAVSVDDGKMQTRAAGEAPGVHDPAWRSHRVGCLQRVDSKVSAKDPQPQPPQAFTTRATVEKLVRELAHSHAAGAPAPPADAPPAPAATPSRTAQLALGTSAKRRPSSPRQKPRRPARPPATGAAISPPPGFQVYARTCVATLTGSDRFGAMVAAHAQERGFFLARRCVFLGDGAPGNWTLQQMYFPAPEWLALLDFIHLIEHLWAAARAARPKTPWPFYRELLGDAWNGRPQAILRRLRHAARALGPPPSDAPESDRRRLLRRQIAYLEANQERMDYPKARRLGLPCTTSHVESLIGVFNARVKSSRHFWCEATGDDILQVRAACAASIDQWAGFYKRRAQRHAGRAYACARAAA
jgi:hypothetical protein